MDLRPALRTIKQIQTKVLHISTATIIGLSSLLGAVPLFSAPAYASHAETGVVLVGDSGSISDIGGCGDATNPCNTIEAGVDHAVAGDTVQVAAGTYNEGVTIAKAITLNGPNAGVSALATRASEAVLTSGATTINVTNGQDVIIDGFTINGDFGVYVSGNVNGTIVKNNIITGTARALSLDAAGNGARALNNDLISGVRSLHVSGGNKTDLRVNGNRFSGTPASTGIFFSGNFTIAGFEFNNNQVLHSANIAANISNGTVSGNTFNSATGARSIQISLHNSTLSNNTFQGNNTRACLQIFGSQFGLVPSTNLTVSGNTFGNCNAYGIQLSPDITNITVSGNTFTNSFDAINTRSVLDDNTGAFVSNWDVTGKNIVISNNSITGSTNKAVNNTEIGNLNASNNWWGSTANPSALISGGVTFAPWCAQEACSSFLSDEPVSLTASGGVATTSSSGPTSLTSTTSASDVSATIPAGTTITDSTGTWDGTLNPPTTTSVAIPETSGFTTTPGISISVGSDSVKLTFDKGVRLVLAGQVGKHVGFIEPGGSFTEITTPCSDDTQAIGDALPAGGDCKIDVGSNLVVWTKHFSKFATYSLTPVPSSSGGSSSGTTSTTTRTRGGTAAQNDVLGESATPAVGSALSTNIEKLPAASTATPAAAKKAAGLQWYWWVAIIAAALAIGSAIYLYRFANIEDRQS